MRPAIIVATMFLVFVSAQPVWAARLWTAGQALTYTEGSVSMPYRLYLPKDYSSSESYPLVLFMHGSGERGNNNSAQVQVHIAGLIDRTYEAYPAILIAPQIPTDGYWSPYYANDLSSGILANVRSNYSVDPRRIYATGLSMGGYGVTTYAVDSPSLFAAIAPMSGATSIPSDSYQGPLGELPTWLFHGGNDTTVYPVRSRDYYRNATGLATISYDYTYYGYPTAISDPIRYTELTGQGHVIWDPIYANSSPALYDWMFAQAIPEPSSFGLMASGLFVAGWFALRRLAKRGT